VGCGLRVAGCGLRVVGKKGIEQGAWRMEKDTAQWKVQEDQNLNLPASAFRILISFVFCQLPLRYALCSMRYAFSLCRLLFTNQCLGVILQQLVMQEKKTKF
jgi:hypothetical protein